MSNKITPVDHGMLGKISDKLGETATTKKLDADSSAVAKGVRGGSDSSDTVNLTSGAKLLERVEKTLAELPAIDSANVAAVRTSIENGDYVIDADKIAETLLRSDQELGE